MSNIISNKESLKNFDFNNDYKNVDIFVLKYIEYKKYNLTHNYSVNINPKKLPGFFSPIKGFIYDIGMGYKRLNGILIKNNCQIMSLFYSLSETFRKIPSELKSEIAGFFRLYIIKKLNIIKFNNDTTTNDFLSTDLLNSLCEYFNISLLLIVFDETQKKYRIDFINSNKNIQKGKELENTTLKPCISLHHINSNHFVSIKLAIDERSFMGISFYYSFIFNFSTSLYNLYNSIINKEYFISRQIQKTKHKFGNSVNINGEKVYVYSSIVGNNINSNDFYYYKPTEKINISYNTESINIDSKFIIDNGKIVRYSTIRNKDKKMNEIKKGNIKLFVKIQGNKIVRIYDSRIEKKNKNNNTPPPLMTRIQQNIYKELNITNREKYENILTKIYYKVLEKNPEILKNQDNFDKIFFEKYIKPIIRSLKNTKYIITEEKIDKICNYIITSIEENFYNHNYNKNITKILKTKYNIENIN
jgi:hypothetical protein